MKLFEDFENKFITSKIKQSFSFFLLILYHKIMTFTDPKEGFGKIVGKGENAGCQHFLLFPCFLSLTANFKFSATFILSSANAFNLHWYEKFTMTPFDTPGNKPFENTVGKGEIARNKQFLLFPQCFLPVWITFCHFCQI